eukprot:356913-Chlamydomonas_euryale.AAC.8
MQASSRQQAHKPAKLRSSGGRQGHGGEGSGSELICQGSRRQRQQASGPPGSNRSKAALPRLKPLSGPEQQHGYKAPGGCKEASAACPPLSNRASVSNP